MRRVLIKNCLRATVLLSAFLIGVAFSSFVGHRKSSKTERLCTMVPTSDSPELPCMDADYSLLPSVSYCALMATPQDYENKLVRLRLDFRMRIGMLRRDEICTNGAFDFQMDLVAGTNGIANEGNAGLLPKDTVFDVVGRFRRKQTALTRSSNKYQLELIKIDSVALP